MKIFKHIQYLIKLKSIIFLEKKLVVALAVIKLITMLLSFLPPFIYQYYINNVITDKNMDGMSYVIAGYVVLFTFQSFVISLGKYLETRYSNLLSVNLRKQIFHDYSKMPYILFENKDIGELRIRAEDDIETICQFYIKHCLDFFFAIFYSVCVLRILFFLNGYLTVFGCMMIALSYFITKVLVAKIVVISKKYREDLSDFDTTMHDALQNWKEVKINNIENVETNLLGEKWSQLSQSKLKKTRYKFLQGALVAFNLFFVTRMNLYFFGGLLVIYDLMTVPTMLVFMNYYEQLHTNIQTILDSMVNLGEESPQIDKILFSLEEINYSIERSVGLEDLNGDIEIKNLNFQYLFTDRIALKDISLKIKGNKSYAIVGKSGSGKTTLVKLLVGLYSPMGGDIIVNNINLKDVPQDIKCHYINIVMQDPQFFNMSILDNLLLAKPSATMQEIEQVCKVANIFDFIQEMPDKYKTLIGENGIKLSGGLKQRLAIARTMLLNPKVLIFDEATSALDQENEEMVVSAIDKLSQHRTIIIISHRLTSIIRCNEAIVIQNGTIIAQELMNEITNKNNAFHELFNREIHE